MAGLLVRGPAHGCYGWASGALLRFPVARRGGPGASADGIVQHYAVPHLLDGSVRRSHGFVSHVFFRLSSTVARFTATDTASIFSSVLPVVRTSPSRFLAFSCRSLVIP
jgi:hypothetical protein